ncbi:substrate-binding domain-containing protein [Paractinoplanes atraurantiacus]|uniref:LacI family transcriptional regulator n=1 Tax=Paractinoplanes atraurantiacus TaxID=1036182 RepID=A0A285JP15_9ACTN|nr:substrate-binding domain-containing protein [Actinoplanes atraurantiacus]SNY61813.1 LacI family transcriptional regulator [Actinoplanes atraurantiacus]
MTGTIGVFLDDVSNPFSAALHRAIEEEARAHNAHVLTGKPHDPLTKSFDGLILASAGPLQTRMPTVVVEATATPVDSVVSTNISGAATAVRHLIAQGHRRIAYLGDGEIRPASHDRYRGYLRALGGRPGPVVHDLHDQAAAERAVVTLMRGPTPPTAIFAAHNTLTMGAVRALRRLDRHRSVALVGFDDFPLADLLDPAITVVAQDPARMGRTATAALFERIEGHSGPPREIRIPTTLIPRGSGEL